MLGGWTKHAANLRLVLLPLLGFVLLLIVTSRHRALLRIFPSASQHGNTTSAGAASQPPLEHEPASPAADVPSHAQHAVSTTITSFPLLLANRFGPPSGPPELEPRVNCPRLQVLLRNGSCADAMPSCQLTDLARHDCVAGPSSCECLAECEAAWHLGVPSAASPSLIPCFYSNGSRLPSLDDALTQQWYWFPRARTVDPGCNPLFVPETHNPAAGEPIDITITLLTSLTKCDQSCNGRGWCMLQPPAWGIPSALPPTCACFHPWTGPACSLPSLSTLHHSTSCLNNCSGRGTCQHGICLCHNHTSHGVDCSLPLSPPDSPLTAAPTADVYVYELPPGFNSWWGNLPGRDLGRSLHAALLRSPHRTSDPERAAIFWLPVEPLGLVSYGQALLALDYVRQAFPYYNRSQGRDHAIAYGWDSGSCWIARHPLAINTIQVSHFGLDHRSDKMFCSCKLCGPGFTLLVPDIMEQHYKALSPRHYGRPDTSPRPTWLFFSGSITGTERAALAALVANATFRSALPRLRPRGKVQLFIGDQAIGNRTSLGLGMRLSKFCLAPPGAGFGTRGTLAILLGCVPVYIGDLRQPWDDVLDYSTFSLRVRVEQLPQLLDIVAGADYPALRAGLDRVWHMFSWASVFGPVAGEPLQGDAMDMMLEGARRQARQRGQGLRRASGPGSDGPGR